MNKSYFILMLFAAIAFSIGAFFNSAPAFANSGMEGCIKNCSSCSSVCKKALDSERSKGKGASSALTKALADCESMCRTSEGMLTRGSDFHPKACGLCAEVCGKCAELCEKSKDPSLQNCAKECRKCEDSCKKMAS